MKLVGRRAQAPELRRRAALPEHRHQGSAGRHQDHVELRLQVIVDRRRRPAQLRRRHRRDRDQRADDRRAPLPARPLPPPVLDAAASTSIRSPSKPNPNGYRRQEGLYPILEPFDLKGVGALGYRYLDPGKQDDSLALPAVAPPRAPALDRAALRRALRPGHRRRQLRRLRRPDRAGWTGSSSARRKCSASFHATHYPGEVGRRRSTGPSTTTWEKRKVYVVEGVSKLPQYAYSKRVIFIDKEAWRIPYSRHLRPLRRALEGLDQQLQLPQAGLRRARSSIRTRWPSARPS